MSHINPDDLAAADSLPALYEAELRRAFAAQPDGGGALIERLLARQNHVEVTLPNTSKTLLLYFDPTSATLIVRDPIAPEGVYWQWRRLRRLVLRDRLLRDLSKHKGTVQELSPLVQNALRYPRPKLPSKLEIPALLRLQDRSDSRLAISENVTFDRTSVPAFDKIDDTNIDTLRSNIQKHLAALTPDQTAAMVQDGVFETAKLNMVPIVFPVEDYDSLTAIVQHANAPARVSVSLALPVEAMLNVDLGPDHAEETAQAKVTLLFLDLKPEEVMAAIRENTLSGPAETILEQNGLSLLSLSIRESRAE